MDHPGSRVALPFSPFPDRGFVKLPIVSANTLEIIPCAIRGRLWMSTDTAGIHDVRLLQLVGHARLFGEIAICGMDIGKQCFRLLIDAPADDTHLGCIPKTPRLTCNCVLLMRSVDELMAGLTQRDEIVWTIATSLPRLR